MVDLHAIARQFYKMADAVPTGQQPERMLLIDADAAGRLLADAIDAGAFAEASRLQKARAEHRKDFKTLWILARQDFITIVHPTSASMSSDSKGWQHLFADDCRVIADLIESEADELHPAQDEPVLPVALPTTDGMEPKELALATIFNSKRGISTREAAKLSGVPRVSAGRLRKKWIKARLISADPRGRQSVHDRATAMRRRGKVTTPDDLHLAQNR